MLRGSAEMHSPFMSNEWWLSQDGEVLATLRRFGRARRSRVTLADHTVWDLEPNGWGVVEALEEGVAVARIVRRSWFGRLWEAGGVGFSFNVVSRPRPRRWAIEIGGAPVAELAGSMLSYNRLRIDSPIAVPLVAVALAWQVVVRPWEAAAFAPAPSQTQPGRL